ncbi:MAG: cytochrome o ubiquinol/quinol oxidase subunit IV [Chlamydiales bacterium]
MHIRPLFLRVFGLVASLILTLGTFFIATYPAFFHLETNISVLVILILAVLQAIVQAVCFLHLSAAKEARWNLGVFITTISIIITIIAFSIWIMNHLNYNMMH